ncbi:tyrosine--tRNA ligase [Zavarzinia sp. CC-PAN008]|uniref:tyrosine--tRNA ligase n=1 Tax=Zavarzinia sp. CC-PAN008 TaxID=3243332 RepID=UPI003F748CD8
MSENRSLLLRRLATRGYIHQCTDQEGLDALATEGPVTAYVGYDCTGPSLHIGHLVSIMMLRTLQQTGHKPIVLMGGGTTRIGDPSGKDEQRQFLTDETIAANMASIRQVFSRFITFGDGPTDAVMVNNADWLDGLDYIGFLRDYGRHFSVNRMLSMDSVRLRLEREQPLSFLEFNYMVLQSYDFVELSRRLNVRLQMGGSDQWGNIVQGVELGRRAGAVPLFGLTTPLITTASGAKMGKTAKGAVWLNDDMLPAYDYWQFWRNTEDADVGRFLRLFTDVDDGEIARLETLQGAELNDAKKILATEATRLCRGADAAASAAETARATFEAGSLGADLPTVELPRATFEAGVSIVDLLVQAGLATSRGEAKRLVAGGGARLNDAAISDEQQRVDLGSLASGPLKLSAGKKRHALVKAV